ncbi:MAG: hypothetical protein U5O69_04165 [Candidatus Competibacteraceae bacterium]|nr:hypothetical protein [Candidatus Competibacteraceae bacterium]
MIVDSPHFAVSVARSRNQRPGETTREWGRPIAMSADVKQRVDALWGELGL